MICVFVAFTSKYNLLCPALCVCATACVRVCTRACKKVSLSWKCSRFNSRLQTLKMRISVADEQLCDNRHCFKNKRVYMYLPFSVSDLSRNVHN